MNVLIINPPQENLVAEFQDDRGRGFLEASDFGSFPPLGPLYVLTHAEIALPGNQYYFLDCIGEKISHKALRKKIAEIRPDVVGIAGYTIALIDVIKAAETVRLDFPDAHLCLGGHHPTAFPIEAASLTQFDSIIVGEGEYAFSELLKRLEVGGEIDNITGLYTRKTIGFQINNEMRDPRYRKYLKVPAAYVDNIDDLPFPNRKHIKHINYNSIVGLKNRLATIITSRGCPCNCSFCDVPYKKYRPRKIEFVLDEIQACLDMGYEEFHFYDDLFNISAKRVEEFCLSLKRRGFDIVWDFRGRVNGVSRETLALAKSAGLRMVSFGVETGTDEGLEILQKGITVAEIKQVFRWCRELKIKTVADFMIGIPNEKSAYDIRKNIKFLIDLDPDYAQIGILNLYPHTELFEKAVSKGIVKPGRWEKWSLKPVPGFFVDHWTEYLSDSDLVRLHRESYRRFYFRFGYIVKSFLSLRSLHEFKSKIIGVFKLLSRT